MFSHWKECRYQCGELNNRNLFSHLQFGTTIYKTSSVQVNNRHYFKSQKMIIWKNQNDQNHCQKWSLGIIFQTIQTKQPQSVQVIGESEQCLGLRFTNRVLHLCQITSNGSPVVARCCWPDRSEWQHCLLTGAARLLLTPPLSTRFALRVNKGVMDKKRLNCMASRWSLNLRLEQSSALVELSSAM